jgi:hypothetical protein
MSNISVKMNEISVVKPNISVIGILSVEKQHISVEMSNISVKMNDISVVKPNILVIEIICNS